METTMDTKMETKMENEYNDTVENFESVDNEKEPKNAPEKNSRSLLQWIRGDKIIVWTIAILLGNAIVRLVSSFFDDVFDPIVRTVMKDPNNERPFVKILGVNLRLRDLVIAILQFIIIIFIAYLLSQKGTVDPGHYMEHHSQAHVVNV